MAGPKNSVAEWRVDIPTLEPDDLFVARLASLAVTAGAAGPAVIRPRNVVKIALAAASVAVIATGGAWASGALPGHDGPVKPTAPVTRPAVPDPTNSEPTGEQSSGDSGVEPNYSAPGTPAEPDQPVAGSADGPHGTTGTGTAPDHGGPSHDGGTEHAGGPGQGSGQGAGGPAGSGHGQGGGNGNTGSDGSDGQGSGSGGSGENDSGDSGSGDSGSGDSGSGDSGSGDSGSGDTSDSGDSGSGDTSDSGESGTGTSIEPPDTSDD